MLTLPIEISERRFELPMQLTFCGPARQYRYGALGAFAMRIGRVAISLVKQYVMPVVKEIGKNLLSAFVPEISNVISGKRPKAVLAETLKESASKTIASTTSAAASKRVNARAYPSNKPIASLSEIARAIATPRRAVAGRAMEPAGTGWGAGRRQGGEHNTEKSRIGKFAARSRSDILSRGIQQLGKNLVTKQHITKEGVMNTSSSNQNLYFEPQVKLQIP